MFHINNSNDPKTTQNCPSNLWAFFLVMGGIMYLIQWLATIALHYARATVLGPLTYSSIIVSGIIGWMVWGQIPIFLTLVGMFAIIVSGILIVMFESRERVSIG